MSKKNDEIKILTETIQIAGNNHYTNCYILWDEQNNGVVIDPAFDEEKIINKLKENNIFLKAIFITHCHADHIAALKGIMDKYSDIKVYIHQLDINGINKEEVNCQSIVNVALEDVDIKRLQKIQDGDEIKIDNMTFEVIHTPGHTKGSIMLYLKQAETLFTGDTIFENTYGRTDLETGSHEDMKNSLEKVFGKFNNILCLPGHGNKFILSEVKRRINLLFAFKG